MQEPTVTVLQVKVVHPDGVVSDNFTVYSPIRLYTCDFVADVTVSTAPSPHEIWYLLALVKPKIVKGCTSSYCN